MATWISSKLRVAETFFEQIDQQAAEPLKKNERPRSEGGSSVEVSAKAGGGTVSLKDQLKKKSGEVTASTVENQGKFRSDLNVVVSSDNANDLRKADLIRSGSGGGKEILDFPRSSPKPKPTLTDSDWTELLSSPVQNAPSSRSGAGSAIRGLRKVGVGRQVDGKRGVGKGSRKIGEDLKNKKRLNEKPSDGEESDLSARSSSVDLFSDSKAVESKDVDAGLVEKEKSMEVEEERRGNVAIGVARDMQFLEDNEGHSSVKVSEGEGDRGSDVGKLANDAHDSFTSTVMGRHKSGATLRSSVLDEMIRDSSLRSNRESGSDSDSGSSSDSESERERERKKRLLAEKAAANAVEAIKEREDMVARLEGEKLSLEKILEEQAKQQVQEASELHTTMIETMEAVELEKQKHNTTRKEALAKLAKLETANADLAKALAAAQKNLGLEVNQVAGFRQQFEQKDSTLQDCIVSLMDWVSDRGISFIEQKNKQYEAIKTFCCADLRRWISESHETGTYASQKRASRGFEVERGILEAEYLFLTDKVLVLEEKARKLEDNIEMTRKQMEEPTEVEVELKRRLGQLTDHLIQKQAQVEALLSEKATLAMRIQTVSRLIEENNSMASLGDLESGAWDADDAKFRPLIEDKLHSGRKHLGSLVRQLDSIFSAGAVFLRRSSTARAWALVYLVCLHFWVLYILTSHTPSSTQDKSGAVFSLENINNTARE